jgi:hypothetical protein
MSDPPVDPTRCDIGRNLTEPTDVLVSRDGAYVYVASSDDTGPAIFTRDAQTSLLTQLGGTDGCINRYGVSGCGTANVTWTNAVVLAPGCDFAYFGGHGEGFPDDSSITAYSRVTNCAPASSAALPDCTRNGQLDVASTVTDRVGDAGAKWFHYKVDGGPEQVAGTSAGVTGNAAFSLSLGEGKHTLEYWGEDEAHAYERPHRTATIAVDASNPSVSIKSDQNKTRYSKGEKATITVTASDATSGLATDPSASKQSIPTTTLGRHTVTKTATDKCGNSATASFTYEVARAAVAGAKTKKLKLSVTPRTAVVGDPARFAFRVTSRGKAVSGATVTFAGKRVRTDRRGRAPVSARLARVGRSTARATKRGYRAATVTVRGVEVRAPAFTGRR